MSRDRPDGEGLGRELDAVEAVLASLAPTASSLDFPEVMYLAGRASARAAATRRAGRAAWIWPSLAVASLLVAVTLAVAWTYSGAREVVVERIVYVEREEPAPVPRKPIERMTPPEAPDNPWHEYARLRQVVLSQGPEGLPEPDLRPLSDPGSPPWDVLHGAARGAWPEG